MVSRPLKVWRGLPTTIPAGVVARSGDRSYGPSINKMGRSGDTIHNTEWTAQETRPTKNQNHVSIHALHSKVDVRFENLPQVMRGQPVMISSPALDEPLQGEALFLNSQADIQKNTLEVKVAVNNPPTMLKPEMLVDATFLAPERAASQPEAGKVMRVFVPQQLIQSDQGDTYVWVADQVRRVARRTHVVVGMRGKNVLVEIKSGLTVSSKLIAPPYDGLRDGTRIRITKEDSSFGMQDD